MAICETFLETLMRKCVPVPEAGCWLWTAATSAAGYGIFGRKYFQARSAHRAAYALLKGEIPRGMHVCHKCDTPSCVNPDHLFLGTIADNNRDRSRKGRYLGEWNGRVLLTESQVRSIRAEYIAMGGGRAAECGLGAAYGVHRRTIYDIAHGITWRATA